MDDPTPTIAVVICTRDRSESLLTTLRSLRTQTNLPDELIIVDDGRSGAIDSDTRLKRAADSAAAWRMVRAEGIGLTRARNQAARIATSDLLLYLDDDVTCEPIVVEEITRLMRDPLVAGVTATVIEPAFSTISGRLYQFGYRVAGWWRVGPRGLPPKPTPAVLSDPSVAVRARWLSGAAMALRREVVLANPFDETLAEYALGEDREMGYRLAARHWLLESRRARVVHRREASGRSDPRRLGFMSAYNYVRIIRKTCRLGAGDTLVMAWSLCTLAMMHAAWGLVGNRKAHLGELRGLISGAWSVGIGSLFEQSPRNGKPEWRGTPSANLPRMRDASITLPRAIPRGMRTLFVTNRLETGGAERMLLTLVKQLPALGIEPVVACLQDAGPLAGECIQRGIVVHDRVLHHKTDAAVILRLRQIIEAADIDVVVVGHSGGDRMFWSTLAARVSNLPVVVWSHWFPQPGVRHIERANRVLYRWIDAFIALGHRHRDALIQCERVPAGRVSIIRNGIELDRFDDVPDRNRLRAELGLTPGDVGVGLIANLRPEKRHDRFIAAARRLAPRDPRLRFFIVGDGPLRETVAKLVADAGLNDRTLRLLGPRSDTAELLSALDIACLCSDVECLPVIMLEAAAAGCAFIGPDVGSMDEFLVHRQTGLAINASDGVALADAIAELSGDPVLRTRLAEAAGRRVRAEFSAAGMAKAFSKLLHGAKSRRFGTSPLMRRQASV